MKKISVVIPVYNEEKFIGALLQSLARVDYPKELFEVIVVSDGSTDSTAHIVKSFSDVTLIELPENIGRYKCREKGASAAHYPNILFVDSRATVDSGILKALDQTTAKVACGHVIDPPRPGLFETFFRAIRRLVFRSFYQNYDQAVLLTPENFDRMPKGTTVLFVEKDVLFHAYESLAHVDMGKLSSDDIKLLRTIVDQEPLLIHPGMKIVLHSRSSFRAGVTHLLWRGTNFVDYYFHPSKRNFWLVIVFPLLALVALALGLVVISLPFLTKVFILLGMDFLITLLLSRSLRDFGIILFIMPLCVLIFYAGIVRGIYLKSIKALRQRFYQPAAR